MRVRNFSASSGQNLASHAGIVEDARGFGIGALGIRQHVEAMVGNARAQLVKRIVAPAQRIEKAAEVAAVHARCAGEPLDPHIENTRLIHRQRLVRTESRINAGAERLIGAHLLVMLERVGGIVRGADGLDLARAQDAARGHLRLRQTRVGLLPDRGGGTLVERRGDAEVILQLEMSPVVKRIADQLRDRFGKCEILLVRRRVAGAEALRDAVGPHGPPFIMIAGEPDFSQVGEAMVRCDLRRRQVAVVIENRFRLGIRIIERVRRFGLEEKIGDLIGHRNFRDKPNGLKGPAFAEKILPSPRLPAPYSPSSSETPPVSLIVGR